VALDAQGHSSFERLQERMHVRAPQREPVSRKYASFYFAFDLLYWRRPTTFAKRLCSSANSSCNVCFTLPNGFATPTISWNTGNELFATFAEQNGLEGIVAKQPTAPTFPIEAHTG